jgi:hypothetical protein
VGGLLLALPVGIQCIVQVGERRTGPSHRDETAALWVLKSLRKAEREYRWHHPGYAPIHALDVRDPDGRPLKEGERHPRSGYTFTCTAGADRYTIVAVPPHPDLITFTLTETGDIRP